MGRSRSLDSKKAQSTKKSRSFPMTTKQQLTHLPTPADYVRPDISIKVLRSLARRKAYYRSEVRPVFYTREVHLSMLYKKGSEKYIDQVFEDVQKIGQGCFGDVFKARSRENGGMYAIKVTNDTHAFVDYEEVRRLETIPEHENLIKFYMAWQDTYRLYIQMELCLTSLDKVIVVYHHIDERFCWEILLDVALGLQQLHELEFIHLDIKPANIMVTAAGVCKIGDFGLLKDLREGTSAAKEKKKAGAVSEGDGKYVAWEVLQERKFTKAADVFSLGLMMLEVASDAALPKSGDSWKKIRRGEFPNCYLERPLTEKFRRLVDQMLVSEYEQRPSVDDILENSSALEIFQNRKQIGRMNFMAVWEQDYRTYAGVFPQAAIAIPAIQVQGPSPPRRSYPINRISPVSPIRSPLRELDMGELPMSEDNNSDEEGPSGIIPVEQRYRRARNVVRRLFTQ